MSKKYSFFDNWQEKLGLGLPDNFSEEGLALLQMCTDDNGSSYIEIATVFAKYINIVGDNEGVDFLYENDWTPSEWELIGNILGIADRQLRETHEDAKNQLATDRLKKIKIPKALQFTPTKIRS